MNLTRPNYISPSSLKKWIKDKSARAGHYLIGVKNDNTYTAMEVGSAVHKAIEQYNLGYNHASQIQAIQNYLKDLLNNDKINQEEYNDLGLQALQALDNFRAMGYVEIKPEVPGRAEVGLPFPILAIADGLEVGSIVDYKIVGKFTNPEEQPTDWSPVTKYMEYKIQARENALILKQTESEKPLKQVIFREILKSDGTPPTTIKVDELIDLCMKKHGEDISLIDEKGKKLTKDGLIEKYDPKTETVRDIIFEVTDERLAEGYDYLNKYMTEIDELCKQLGAK